MATKKASTGRTRKAAAGTKRGTAKKKKSSGSHEELLGRVISDSAFRQELFANPRNVLKNYYSGEELKSAMGFVGLLDSAMSQKGDDALDDLKRMKMGFL